MDSELLLDIYNRLRKRYGPQCWWPAETPFEVIVGAILTQNTAWRNVTRAIENLKKAGVFSAEKIAETPESRLAELIRPSGYFNQKARRLKGFMVWFRKKYGCNLEQLFARRVPALRAELLALNGIGPETADSILLYAGGKKTFVVDAYTRRIFSRHGFFPENATYEEMKAWFELRLPRRTALYNDFHAQIVHLGVAHCRKRPLCAGCPLEYLFELVPARSRPFEPPGGERIDLRLV